MSFFFFQTALLLSNLPFETVGKAVEIEQLYDAVNLTLSLQVRTNYSQYV